MNKNTKKPFPNIIILLLLAALLTVFPLIIHMGGEFEGSDDLAGEAIEELAPEYEPWFEPIFEPSSEGMEKILFLFQGLIGASIMIYTLDKMKKKSKRKEFNVLN